MPKFVSFERLRKAAAELAEWRGRVNSQQAVHLWQFIALRRSGVDSVRWTRHEEAADQEFWDEVMRVRSGPEPYYDPLTQRFRIETHWHSNVATARKNTFKNRWHAAVVNDGADNEWRLTDNYLDILLDKAWTRGGTVTRVPVNSLCAWLYRTSEFPTEETLDSIRSRFRDEYNLTNDEYNRLFQESDLTGRPDELEDGFFSNTKPDQVRIRKMLEGLAGISLSEDHHEGGYALGVPITAEDGITPEQIAMLLVDGRGQLVLHGPPGTGKTFMAKAAIGHILNVAPRDLPSIQIDPATLVDTLPENLKNGAWSLVQFHPSYVYEDFVRGLRGTVDDAGYPRFEVQDRVFVKLCRLAQQMDGFIVLVIDEINRGDLAKVLGELIYALEYRDEAIALQYTTESGSHLAVPRKLKLIATMNTADRSIAHLDYAIRRRFDFVHCAPDRGVVQKFHEGAALQAKVLALFDSTSEIVGPHCDYAVGHAFFLHSDPEDLARAITFQLLPLLAEYRAEGLIDVESLAVPSWSRGPVSFTPSKPFAFADELASWLSDSEGA